MNIETNDPFSKQGEHGVAVNDAARAWRADGKSFQRLWRRVGGLDAPVDEATVEALIAERAELRKARDLRLQATSYKLQATSYKLRRAAQGAGLLPRRPVT